MWLSNVYLKTLRDYRFPILGWGLGLGLLMYAVFSAVPELLSTPEARASVLSLAGTFTWMAEPVKVDTPGGYATWKYGFTILVIAIWPLLVGSRMLRGEEERGQIDSLLALPHGRPSVALQKLAAMWTALLIMAVLIGLLTYGGASSVGAENTFADCLLFGINLALISGVFGSLALLISQFTQEARTASGITGGLLLLSIVLDIVHRTVPGTDWLSGLSPVYYYNLSKPLVPGYGVDAVAMLVLLLLNVVLSAVAISIFVRRDIGRTVQLPAWLRLPQKAMTPEKALPVNDWSLRSVYARSLATISGPTFWWTVAIAGFAAFMIFIVKQIEQQLIELSQGSPLLQQILTSVGGEGSSITTTLLSFMYLFIPVLLMAFAVTQASRWASDEDDGQHELVLSTPQTRLTVLLARFGALTTAAVVITLLALLLSVLTAASSGVTFDVGKLIGASLSIIPLGLLIGALGYLFSGWLRAAVDTGLLSLLLVLWFSITFVGPELGWPEGVLRLSAFYYYGKPLIDGVSLANLLLVIAVAAAALALASVRYMRKDIGR